MRVNNEYLEHARGFVTSGIGDDDRQIDGSRLDRRLCHLYVALGRHGEILRVLQM